MKSAIGIGALLLDGLGDTIRVSLTEDPELEIQPCRQLAVRSHVLVPVWLFRRLLCFRACASVVQSRSALPPARGARTCADACHSATQLPAQTHSSDFLA